MNGQFVPPQPDTGPILRSTREIEKRVTEAFDVYDVDAGNTVNVRDVGTILRSLGCCPTEAELSEIVNTVEDEETSGVVTLERFLPVATQILLERKFPLASEEVLLEAFQVLDMDEKGYLTPEELSSILTTEGEPFTDEELQEMLDFAVNKDTGHIDYTDCVTEMNFGKKSK